MNNEKDCGCTRSEAFIKELNALFEKYPENLYKDELQQQETVDMPIDYLAVGLGPDGAPIVGSTPESITLARFELSNGNLFEFNAIRNEREGTELAVRELVDGERQTGPTILPWSKLSILDIYRILAPADLPIPELLLDSDEKADKKSYKTVEFFEDVISVDLDKLVITPDVSTAGPSAGQIFGGHYCPIVEGYYDFANDWCNASVPANTWWWCDPKGRHYFLDRFTIDHERKNSIGITAACHGPAVTSHYYRTFSGGWQHLKLWYLPAGYWQWTRWEGKSERDRLIRHQPVSQLGTSFIRCVSLFVTFT